MTAYTSNLLRDGSIDWKIFILSNILIFNLWPPAKFHSKLGPNKKAMQIPGTVVLELTLHRLVKLSFIVQKIKENFKAS